MNKWETAIMTVLNESGGAVTLARFYVEVRKIITKTRAKNFDHNVRAHIKNLKARGEVKLVSMATYALPDFKAEDNIYEEIVNKTIDEKGFAGLPNNLLHGHLQGMLIELGNHKGYDTFTPDKNRVFNGTPLSEISTCEKIPQFTYADYLKKISQIDVIWFKGGYPAKTFDVEHSTDFTKAIVRISQLQNFNAKFYVVADESKQAMFENRMSPQVFSGLYDKIAMVSNQQVFQEYENMLKISKLKKGSLWL